jgi:hypothetical protein
MPRFDANLATLREELNRDTRTNRRDTTSGALQFSAKAKLALPTMRVITLNNPLISFFLLKNALI